MGLLSRLGSRDEIGGSRVKPLGLRTPRRSADGQVAVDLRSGAHRRREAAALDLADLGTGQPRERDVVQRDVRVG